MSLPDDLSLADALMLFLHNAQGQPIQGAQPKALTAAAELSELAHRGLLVVEDDRVRAVSPAPAGYPEWAAEAIKAAGDGRPVKSWVTARRGALAEHQESARRHGLVSRDRKRLFGLLPYGRVLPDATRRRQLVDDLLHDEADPRSRALASLVVRSGLIKRIDLSEAEKAGLRELAASDHSTRMPDPAIGAMEIAIGTAILGATIGE